MKIDLEKFKAKKLRQLEKSQKHWHQVMQNNRIERVKMSLIGMGATFAFDPLKWENVITRIEVSRSGCWEWVGSLTADGYGKFQYEGKRWRAHRLTYFLVNGQIEDGIVICHACDNPKCVNPNHLFAGTHKDNRRDYISKQFSKRRTSGKKQILP